MKKTVKVIFAIILLIITLIALAWIYKFNYLASKEWYDVDGNKILSEEKISFCSDEWVRYSTQEEAMEAWLSYEQFGSTYCPEYKTIIHSTWDIDKNWFVDCGIEDKCDYSIDYSQPKN